MKTTKWSGPAQVEDVLPLSPLQEGLLFHATFDSGAGDPYLVQVAQRLDGPLDVVALRRAAEALVQRHAVLRVGFRQSADRPPLQIVRRQVRVPWAAVDLTGTPEGEREEAFLDDALRPCPRVLVGRLWIDDRRHQQHDTGAPGLGVAQRGLHPGEIGRASCRERVSKQV